MGDILLQVISQDLFSFNTLGLHSSAPALVRYTHPDQLPDLSRLAGDYENAFVLGGGSNVVLAPSLSSLVVKAQSRGIRLVSETHAEWLVEAQAGESWHDFVAFCLDKGWPGLENLALIPGTVGAAPVQNIGAYGVELEERLHSVVAWNLQERRLVEMEGDACRFSYRDSFFKHEPAGRWLIVAVRFRLPKRWQAVLDYADLHRHPVLSAAGAEITPRQVFDAVCDVRRRKLPDPAVLGNAGSFFKNPIVSAASYRVLCDAHAQVVAYPQADGNYKLAAGWLIDRAGWKGRRLGPVGMHDQQALVLVNYGGATVTDVMRLADAVRADVVARFGAQLEQEPIFVS